MIGVPVALMMKEEVDACYTLISLFIFFATTLTICLVFIPKVNVSLRSLRADDFFKITFTLVGYLLRRCRMFVFKLFIFIFIIYFINIII